MTQLEALQIAYNDLSSLMPDGENDEIFEAVEVIGKMIAVKERQQQKLKTTANWKRMKEINYMFDDLLN